MFSQLELLEQMLQVLDLLIDNAEKLCDEVSRVHEEQALEPLQHRQHEILHELAQLDSLLKQQASVEVSTQLEKKRAEVKAKLEEFQRINREFLLRVATHFRTIQKKELSPEVKKKLQEEER